MLRYLLGFEGERSSGWVAQQHRGLKSGADLTACVMELKTLERQKMAPKVGLEPTVVPFLSLLIVAFLCGHLLL